MLKHSQVSNQLASVSSQQSAVSSQQSGKLTLNTTKGIYVFFHYEGSWINYKIIVQRVYLEILPANNLVKTQGYDIECFYFVDMKSKENSAEIICDHYIPVREINKNSDC
ncbi:hypothetical protein [Escherichia coli]|uniref:hypothetical protein n=1 Tax=Escherichia coli TaxID=562 RepID=UPI002738A75E|nr:hypothetical protein [Escherichia coli]